LALILLIGSGLMVKAFWKLQEVDAGMNPSHLLTMRLSLPSVTYKDAASINGFYGGLGARLNALPGYDQLRDNSQFRNAQKKGRRGVDGTCRKGEPYLPRSRWQVALLKNSY
jgi:hypothetical protein